MFCMGAKRAVLLSPPTRRRHRPLTRKYLVPLTVSKKKAAQLNQHVKSRNNAGFNMPHEVALPAAQYLRISTGRQHCSLQNQIDTIAAYARQHGLQIVKT